MIKTLDKYQLIFIHSCENNIYKPTNAQNTNFKELMDSVFEDEFDDKFVSLTKRNIIFSAEGSYQEKCLQIEIYESSFNHFGCSVIYTRIYSEDQICLNEFSLLCSGNKFLDSVFTNEKSLREIYDENNILSQLTQNAFLIAQIQKTSPMYKIDGNIEKSIIKDFDKLIEQILLRSSTHRHDLRPDNHIETHINFSNFYGSVDFSSQNTLVQVYQRPVRNLFNKSLQITADYRICWWLAVLDVLHLQKFVLEKSEERIDVLDFNSGKDVVNQIDEIDNIIRDLKKYWSLDSMTHPMSKVVTKKLQDRMGLTDKIRRVQDKLSISEKIITRNIDESRNRQVTVLNYLIIILAGIELFPFIQQVVYTVLYQVGFDLEPPAVFMVTTGFGILLPLLLFAYVGSLRRKYRSRTNYN